MMGKHSATCFVTLSMLAMAVGAAAWGLSSAPPRFSVVPAGGLREGKGHVDSLREGAATEGFLDRVLGTNCFSQAVSELTADCRRMEQEQKTRLALRLMNCQLAVQGADTHPCPKRAPLKECTATLPERAYSLFVEFLTHADSMCLWIQSQDFERYTENMLNRLAEGAGYAREQLAQVARTTGALGKDTAALQKKAEDALGLLRQHSELEQESLKLQRVARAEALAYYTSLDAKQQQSLQLQDTALQKQEALEQGQAAALRMLSDAQGHIDGLLQLVDSRAAELAEAAGRQAEAQRELAGELGGLVDSSRGIRSAVDVVIAYQQRSDSVLMRLLGKSYTLEDAAFYGAGVLAAMAAGVSPATAKAKLPVMALMGACLVGERVLLDRLHMWMDIGENNEIVMNLPLPNWLPLLSAVTRTNGGGSSGSGSGGIAPPAAAAMLQFNFKWALRRVAAAVGAALFLYSLLSYRDYERDSYRLLRQLEEDQRRRHEEYLALIRRQKIELAALLGGGSGAIGTGGSGSSGGGGSTGESSGRGRGAAQGRRGQHEAGGAAAQYAAVAAAGRQLALLGAGAAAAGRLTPVAEEGEEEEEDEWDHHSEDEEQSMHEAEHITQQQQQQQRPPAPSATAAVATPASKDRKNTAASARPKSAPVRKAAAAQGRQKRRGATDEAEAAGPAGGSGSKRRSAMPAAGRRRSSLTPEAEAQPAQMEVDEQQLTGVSGRQQGGKRGRRGSSVDHEAGQAAASKRARRR